MMANSKLIILPIVAALVTFISMPLFRRLSIKFGAVAIPDEARKIHKFIIPSAGGLAILLGFVVATLFIDKISPEVIGFLVGGLIVTLMGTIDEKIRLTPAVRLICQTLAALVVIYAGVKVDFIGNFGNGNDGLFYLGFLSIPFTLFWIVGITNAINLIDGLDGLAGGVTAISAGTLGTVALLSGRPEAAILCFILAAVSVAYLPYNFSDSPKRKTFMGDGGSNFMGYSLAVLSILGAVKVAAAFSMLVPIFVLAIPIFDTLFAIVRRLLAGKSPFEADRLHLHHRILDRGLTQRQTTCIIYAICLVLGGISIASMSIEARLVPVLFAMTLTIFLLVLWKLGLVKVTKKKK